MLTRIATMGRVILVAVLPLVGSCGDDSEVVAVRRDASMADASPDACIHATAGVITFTGCTCGDVLRISPVNPDLAECVAP